MMKKILILVGGGVGRLAPFLECAKDFNVEVICASFSELSYATGYGQVVLKIGTHDLAEFDVIYFRLIEKRAEDAALVTDYAVKHEIKIVDSVFLRPGFTYLPMKKSLETKLLHDAGFPVPQSFFGALKLIKNHAFRLFGYPFILKGTYGKRGWSVWLVKNEEEFVAHIDRLLPLEKKGKRYIAQEFIKITERVRVMVVGNRAIGSVTFPTKWRRYVESLGIPGCVRGPLVQEESYMSSSFRGDPALSVRGGCHELAVRASRELGIDIAGVDIIRDNKTGKVYILEVNSAPRWEKFKEMTGINVEREILKYLVSLV